ncbi:C40 family peptidase [Pseudonocardia sp. WMMC193]|uniref:C40 family peptidase n=1 Tax=Pseudonocardia sp. WMMC193 TaxID=2911965 RepID=UPI001F43C7D8|nr:C40 family peptidase [Pseudonocardia sp. WMMC193]MCF7552579.1 C40 family peptidase [Pseudonocardia sp. WMMC193]
MPTLLPAAPPPTRRRVVGGLAGVLVLAGVAALAALSAVVASEPAFDSRPAGCVAGLTGPLNDPPSPRVNSQAVWTPDQRANAHEIVATGDRVGAPERAKWIALATAMQESTLVNLPGGDRDSVGLFQQRPSQGWGTPEQLRTPDYAAGRFYERLLAIPGWETMPLTEAAQAVQRSAFPEAYAKWEQPAADLLAETGGTLDALICASGTAAAGAATAALEYSGLQLGKRYEWGATGPESFDCSGLTLRAWQAAGVQLPRTSREQARSGGRQVPRGEAQPGDLLFWSTNEAISGIHHVALYLGDNQIREAPTTGVPVRDRLLGGDYDQRELMPFVVRPV